MTREEVLRLAFTVLSDLAMQANSFSDCPDMQEYRDLCIRAMQALAEVEHCIENIPYKRMDYLKKA